MHFAAASGQEELLEMLCEKSKTAKEHMRNGFVNMVLKDSDDDTPLHVAARNGRLSFIKCVADHCGNCDSKSWRAKWHGMLLANSRGQTPMDCLVIPSDTERRDYLLMHKFPPELIDCALYWHEQLHLDSNFDHHIYISYDRVNVHTRLLVEDIREALETRIGQSNGEQFMKIWPDDGGVETDPGTTVVNCQNFVMVMTRRFFDCPQSRMELVAALSSKKDIQVQSHGIGHTIEEQQINIILLHDSEPQRGGILTFSEVMDLTPPRGKWHVHKTQECLWTINKEDLPEHVRKQLGIDTPTGKLEDEQIEKLTQSQQSQYRKWPWILSAKDYEALKPEEKKDYSDQALDFRVVFNQMAVEVHRKPALEENSRDHFDIMVSDLIFGMKSVLRTQVRKCGSNPQERGRGESAEMTQFVRASSFPARTRGRGASFSMSTDPDPDFQDEGDKEDGCVVIFGAVNVDISARVQSNLTQARLGAFVPCCLLL